MQMILKWQKAGKQMLFSYPYFLINEPLHNSEQIKMTNTPYIVAINYLTWTSCGSSAAILASLVYSILLHVISVG